MKKAMSMNSSVGRKINLIRGVATYAAIVGSVLLSGCSHGPKIKPLSLSIHPEGQAPNLTIPVYVAGATKESTVLKAPVDQVLQEFAAKPPDPAKVKMFHLTQTVTNITTKDPQWKSWNTFADHIVVIADLPRNFGGAGSGANDRRRVEVPLDKRRWNDLPKNTVDVRISEKAVWLDREPGPVP